MNPEPYDWRSKPRTANFFEVPDELVAEWERSSADCLKQFEEFASAAGRTYGSAHSALMEAAGRQLGMSLAFHSVALRLRQWYEADHR